MNGWADVIECHAASPRSAGRLVGQLRACEAAAIAFCRLARALGARRRGARDGRVGAKRRSGTPPTASRRRSRASRRRSPRYLLELEPERAEGRSWYGGPGAGELVEWRPVLERAGVGACPNRVAAVYLELAVLVRALQGLDDAARLDVPPDRSSLWAGLFDLRDTLFAATVDDLRALAA